MNKVSIRLVAGLSSKRVRARLSRANRLCDAGQRAIAFYLHETKTRGLHQEWGYGSVVAYATSELGLKSRSARD